MSKRNVAIFLLVAMAASLVPFCALGTPRSITVDNNNGKPPDPIKNRGKLYYSGMWDVKVGSSSKKGVGVDNVIEEDKKPYDTPHYIFLGAESDSEVKSWVEHFDGNWDFVKNRYRQFVLKVDGKNSIYISFLAHLCGANPGYWKANSDGSGYQNVTVTPKPAASINTPSSVKAGEPTRISIEAKTYVQFSHPDFTRETGLFADAISVFLEIDGRQIISDINKRQRNYSKTITHTFEEAGTHTVKLTAEDVVGRKTTTTKTINVTSTPPPPLPPGSISANIQMELDPSSIKEGKKSDVDVALDAARSRSSGSGPFDTRWWVKVNSKWVTPSEGKAVKGGLTYSATALGAKAGDKIWAQVRVFDWSLNKYDEAETERVILEEGEEPEPEPIPEDPPKPPPEPEPPVARFTMPEKMTVGKKVKITNTSYDPDGPEWYGVIMECIWEISPYEDLDDKGLKPAGGYVIFNKAGVYTVTLTVIDQDGLSDTVSHDIEITNLPPVAVITAADEVIQGEEVVISPDCYDPDGNLADNVDWTITPNTGFSGELIGNIWNYSTLIFYTPGEYKLTLTAYDTCGESDTTEKTIIVKPAIPEAYFAYSGATKVNRKIVLDSSGSMSVPAFPVDFLKNEWQFIPAEGAAADDIKVVSSTDLKTRQVLFKKPGEYKIRLRVTNTAGNSSDWYEQTLKIYPDDPPIADFYVQATVLRDPDNGNKAKIELIDSSYSPDGDTISQRIWKYRYDSNNNGSFSDESWTMLESGNNTNPVMYTTQVGKYLFELSVKEAFGEETIPEFITATNYRKADTSAKPEENKTSEVVNLQPTVDFEAIVKPQIDLSIIGVTNTAELANTITSQANTLVAGLNADGFSVKNTAKVYTEDKELAEEKHGDIYFNSSRHPYNEDYITARNYDYGNHIGDFGRILKYTQTPGPDNFDELRIYANYYQKVPKSQEDPNNEPKISYSSDGNTWYNLVITYTGNYETWSNLDSGKYTGKAFKFRSDYITGNVRYIRVRDGDGDVNNRITYVKAYAYGNTEVTVPTSLNDDKFTSAVYQQSWRDTAEKYVVMISDTEADFTDLQGVIDRYNTEGIKAIVVGTSELRTVGQKIADGTGGAFFEFSGTNVPWIQIQNYLSNILQQQKVITQTILLGQEIDVKTYYSDPEGDPKHQERWLYDHDPTYFENSQGLADFSGQYLSWPKKSFDKVGKYDVVFQARDNPKNNSRFDNYRLWSYMPLNKLELYVHRKPIASFTTAYKTRPLDITEDFGDKNLDFAFSGDWERTNDESYRGSYSYYSGDITNSETSSTQFTVTVPATAKNAKISFYYLTSSESNDYFNFYMDGNRLIHESGNGDWTLFSSSLSQGIHTFEFEYYKSRSGSKYEDATFIDNVTIQYDGSLYLNSTSYDLDHKSESRKGITEEEWKWKETIAETWNSGKPSTLALNKKYLVWLRVKDVEGAWSDPYVQTLSTMNENLPPIAQFTVNPSTQIQNKVITITDQSYDPNGDPIAEWKWRVQKPNGAWVDYGGTKPTNIPSLGAGTYTIELKVRDNPRYGTSMWSEPYTQQVTVIPENNKPVARFIIGPNLIISDESYTINDTSYDPDGDLIVAREWKVKKPNGTWVNISDWKPTFEDMGLDDDGTYTIQLRVMDDPTKRHPALTPLWSDPYTVTVQVEGKLTVIGDSEKGTYAAGQALLLDAETEGKAFKVEAQCWWNHNEYTSTNTTTLVPDRTLSNPPQKEMTWHSRRERGDRDIIVIIPMKTADGTYPVKFTAYKRKADGSTKTAEDIIYVKVKGTIYDYSHSEIIGK